MTEENIEPLLDAARHKSSRDVERLIACLHPQPDSVPDGDLAKIVDRALTLLLQHAERTKHAATSRPRATGESNATGRHVPAAVRRAVWSRDGGRCAFVGPDGRCDETGFLEFHHVVPFAAGGKTVLKNLELRCRAHNAHEAAVHFGADRATRRAPS